MNNNKQIKSGVLLSYVSLFAGLAINLFYTPILLEKLGQSEYGVYTLAVSITSYLSLFGFGLSSAYVYFYSKYLKQSEEAVACLNGTFLKLFLGVAVMVFVAGGILSLNASAIFGGKLSSEEDATLSVMIFLLSISMAADFAASIFMAYITANERFVVLKCMSILSTMFKPAISLLLLYFGVKSIAVVIGTLTTVVIIDSFYIIYAVKKLNMRILFKNIAGVEFREIVQYSGYIFIIMIVDQINWNVDKILLGLIKGTLSVAVYGVAAQINTLFMSFSTAVSSVYVPRIHFIKTEKTDEAECNRALTDVLVQVGGFQFLILVLIYSGFCFFGRPFLNNWAGQGYEDAYYVLLLLLGSELIPLTLNVGIEIQRAKNKQKIPTIVATVQAVANVIISIPLCYKWGVIGCSVGTAMVMVCGSVFKAIYYQVVLKLEMKYFWMKIGRLCRGLIVPVTGGILMLEFCVIESYLQIIFYAGIYAMLYLISIVMLGLSKEERSQLTRKLVQFRRQ